MRNVGMLDYLFASSLRGVGRDLSFRFNLLRRHSRHFLSGIHLGGFLKTVGRWNTSNVVTQHYCPGNFGDAGFRPGSRSTFLSGKVDKTNDALFGRGRGTDARGRADQLAALKQGPQDDTSVRPETEQQASDQGKRKRDSGQRLAGMTRRGGRRGG